jgi:hypothetical protein
MVCASRSPGSGATVVLLVGNQAIQFMMASVLRACARLAGLENSRCVHVVMGSWPSPVVVVFPTTCSFACTGATTVHLLFHVGQSMKFYSLIKARDLSPGDSPAGLVPGVKKWSSRGKPNVCGSKSHLLTEMQVILEKQRCTCPALPWSSFLHHGFQVCCCQ